MSAPVPDGSETALRAAVTSGRGFDDAAQTEAACRWALAEIDRLRDAIASHANTLDLDALGTPQGDRDEIDAALYNAARRSCPEWWDAVVPGLFRVVGR
jgi:hypothetical protein